MHVPLSEQVPDHVWLLLATVQMLADRPHQRGPIARPALPHRVGLHVLVQQLVRVQLWAVAWQSDQAQPRRVLGHECLDAPRPPAANYLYNLSIVDHRMDVPDRLKDVRERRPIAEYHRRHVLVVPAQRLRHPAHRHDSIRARTR